MLVFQALSVLRSNAYGYGERCNGSGLNKAVGLFGCSTSMSGVVWGHTCGRVSDR